MKVDAPTLRAFKGDLRETLHDRWFPPSLYRMLAAVRSGSSDIETPEVRLQDAESDEEVPVPRRCAQGKPKPKAKAKANAKGKAKANAQAKGRA